MQAAWNDRIFEITQTHIAPISALNVKISVKKKSDSTKGKSKVTGNELQTITLEYKVLHEAGTDPRAEFGEWESMLGASAPFLLAGVRFGPKYFQLQKVSMNDFDLDGFGAFRSGKIRLEFKEHSTGTAGESAQAEKGKAGSDNLFSVNYKGTDIFPKISVESCIHDMHAESQADTLTLVFNDPSRRWDGWKAGNEEIISVSQELAKTGAMWIHDVKPENGKYTLKASSVPPTCKNSTSKSWEDVRFEQLAKEIAGRHNLSFKAYNLPSVKYDYVCQDNEQDFVFLDKRCKLEGCAFLVYDKTLVVYSEQARENASPAETIGVGTAGIFDYSDNVKNSYKNAEIVNASSVGKYTAPAGAGSRTLHKTIITPMTSQGEADRFARNLLRLENKNQKTGKLDRDIIRQVAPGSAVRLETAGAKSWDGPAFVYHVRNDYKNLKTKIWFRQPLNY